MNGIHDLGGMDGIGPINPTDNDQHLFKEEWEQRMFGMFISCFAGGHYNVDEFRHAIERMDPAHYLQTSYYEHWLNSLETLLVEKGVVTPDELEARKKHIAMEEA